MGFFNGDRGGNPRKLKEKTSSNPRPGSFDHTDKMTDNPGPVVIRTSVSKPKKKKIKPTDPQWYQQIYFVRKNRNERLTLIQSRSMAGIAVACCIIQRSYRSFREKGGAVQLYKRTEAWRERRKERANYVKVDLDFRYQCEPLSVLYETFEDFCAAFIQAYWRFVHPKFWRVAVYPGSLGAMRGTKIASIDPVERGSSQNLRKSYKDGTSVSQKLMFGREQTHSSIGPAAKQAVGWSLRGNTSLNASDSGDRNPGGGRLTSGKPIRTTYISALKHDAGISYDDLPSLRHACS